MSSTITCFRTIVILTNHLCLVTTINRRFPFQRTIEIFTVDGSSRSRLSLVGEKEMKSIAINVTQGYVSQSRPPSHNRKLFVSEVQLNSVCWSDMHSAGGGGGHDN